MKKFSPLSLIVLCLCASLIPHFKLYSQSLLQIPGVVDKDDNILVCENGFLNLLNPKTGEVHRQRPWPEGSPPSLAVISPDGNWLVLGSIEKEETYVHDLKVASATPFSLPMALVDIRFSPDSDRVYLLHSKTFWNSTLSLFKVPEWELIAERKVSDYTMELAVSRDGSRLITSNGNKLIKTLDPLTLETIRVDWETDNLEMLVFHPSSPSIYAGVTPKNGINVRDLDKEENVLGIPPLNHPVDKLAFNANGTYILLMDLEGQVIIWNLENTDEKFLLRGASTPNTEQTSTFSLEEAYGKIRHEEEILALGGIPLDTSHPLFRNDTGKNHRIAPLPFFGYTAETQFFLGLTLDIVLDNKKEISSTSQFSRPSTIIPSVFYGFSGIWSVGVKSEFFHNDEWYFFNDLNYLRSNLSVYYGTGSQAERPSQNRFRNNLFNWQGMVSRQLSTNWFAGLRYDLRNDAPLSLIEEEAPLIPDMEGGLAIGLGPVVRWDTRNDLFFPRQGHNFEIAYLHYGDWLGADFNFNSFILDFRKYLPLKLPTPGSALAMQLLYHNAHGGHTPFYMLPYLGGDRLIRGAWRNLYIDRQSAMLQAELRSDFSRKDPRYGYVVFAGVGDVAENFFSNYSPRPIGVAGLGIRQQLIPKLKLQSRLDISYSTRGDWGIFGGMGVSF